jgi:hypothetical protein
MKIWKRSTLYVVFVRPIFMDDSLCGNETDTTNFSLKNSYRLKKRFSELTRASMILDSTVKKKHSAFNGGYLCEDVGMKILI